MKNITKESDLEEKKKDSFHSDEELDRNPTAEKKAFKNWEEERAFEDNLNKKLRDEGMDYEKIVLRIDAEKAKRYDEVKH